MTTEVVHLHSGFGPQRAVLFG